MLGTWAMKCMIVTMQQITLLKITFFCVVETDKDNVLQRDPSA